MLPDILALCVMCAAFGSLGELRMKSPLRAGFFACYKLLQHGAEALPDKPRACYSIP